MDNRLITLILSIIYATFKGVVILCLICCKCWPIIISYGRITAVFLAWSIFAFLVDPSWYLAESTRWIAVLITAPECILANYYGFYMTKGTAPSSTGSASAHTDSARHHSHQHIMSYVGGGGSQRTHHEMRSQIQRPKTYPCIKEIP